MFLKGVCPAGVSLVIDILKSGDGHSLGEKTCLAMINEQGMYHSQKHASIQVLKDDCKHRKELKGK